MRRLPLLAAVLAALALPAIASAHPLGNFTINHSSSAVVSGDRVYVHYVLDMAEIPTLQGGRIDVASLSRQLVLTVDGKRATLRPIRQRLEMPDGAGGLPTTRLELVLAGPRLRDASSVELRDETYAGPPRLEGSHCLGRWRRAHRVVDRAGDQPVATAARLSRGRALEPARRHAGARKGRAGRRAWHAAAAHCAARRGARLGLRVARHARPRR